MGEEGVDKKALFQASDELHRLHGFLDVVDAEDGGALEEGNGVQYGGAVEGFVLGAAERLVNHGLAGDADEEGVADVAVGVHAGHQFVVVVDGLAEAEAGVDDDVVEAGGVEAGDTVGEETADVGDHVGVDGVLLHGLGGALDVHHDVGDAALGEEVEHGVVHGAARDVIHDDLTEAADDFPRDAGAEGVDGDGHGGVVFPHQLNRPGEASQLLLLVHEGGAGAGGVGSHVDDAGALLDDLADAADDSGLAEVLAPVVERVGGDVQDAHYEGGSKGKGTIIECDCFHGDAF